MPPVFGPLSPSNALLWSWTAGMGTTLLPSQNAWIVNSSPTSFSSSTTRALPPIFFEKISSAYAMMSALDSMCSPKTLTPFPPVSPVGLTTMSVPSSSNPFATSWTSSATTNPTAPLTLCLSSSSRMKLFEVSILAADFDGLAVGISATLRPSERPASSGASGPTTARSTPCAVANSTTLGTSVSSARSTSLASLEMPGFLFFMQT